MPSLIEQVEMFIPPSGSFKTPDLRRYLDLIRGYETSTTDLMLGLSLADQIRLTFSDMRTSTICDRYPEINLSEKRRYRCVAEYLIRQEELTKLRDENGKLIKKIFTSINININIGSITFAEFTLFFPSKMLIFTKSAIFIKNGNFL